MRCLDNYTDLHCDALSLLWLFCNDMWRRKEDGDGGNHGKSSESNETKSINHHSREFPITDYVQFFVMDFHTIGNKFELLQNTLKYRQNTF